MSSFKTIPTSTVGSRDSVDCKLTVNPKKEIQCNDEQGFKSRHNNDTKINYITKLINYIKRTIFSI